MQQALLDAFQENIALIDTDGIIYATNAAWKRFARQNGAAPDYTDIHRNYLSILTDAGSLEEVNGIQAVLDGKLAFYDSSYACPSPQEDRWYLMRVTPLKENEKVVAAVISHRNITLEEQQRREVYDVLESMTDAFYALDTDWRFVYLNDQAACLLRRTKKELLGETIWEAFPETLETDIYNAYVSVATSQKSHVIEQYYPPLETWFEIHIYDWA